MSDEYICDFILSGCCAKKCVQYFTLNEYKNFMRKVVNLSMKEKTDRFLEIIRTMLLAEAEENSEEEEDNNNKTHSIGHVINGVLFDLKILGRTVCPSVFVFLNGISYNKASKIISNQFEVSINGDVTQQEDENSTIEHEESENSDKLTSKEMIISFLEYLYKSDCFVEPMVGYPQDHKRITIFPDKTAVYHYYSIGEYEGIMGDFPEWVKLVGEQPVSEKWFLKVWR